MIFKVCGMREHENISALLALKPSHMGMIFYEASSRNIEQKMHSFPKDLSKGSTKLTGVFVDSSIEFIKKRIKTFDLDAIQLHGKEDAKFVSDLRKELGEEMEIIKAISVKQENDLEGLDVFSPYVDYLLFDTKGKNKGGNGLKFDWRILKNLKTKIPFILAGGIGPEDADEVLTLFKEESLKGKLAGIDINSKFEIEPALKDIEAIKEFKKAIDGS